MPSEPISLVIPCRNEAESIGALLDEVFGIPDRRLAEVIVVDDGSTDATPALLAERAETEPRLLVLTHARAAGQSSAVRTGVRAADCAWVATIDADGQNPPDQVPALIAAAAAAIAAGRRLGLVQGERGVREDVSSRRWASRAANAARAAVLGDGVRDSACGLKLFRRQAYLELPYFEHIHRFLPAMMRREGWDVVVVPVTHRSRQAGRSHYSNFSRALVGFVDLAGAAWLLRRRSPVLPAGGTYADTRAQAAGAGQPAHSAFGEPEAAAGLNP